tara:strand:+ start:237 stop:434 length:198 start_codon:yes stop_codon:yes gene_type:complete
VGRYGALEARGEVLSEALCANTALVDADGRRATEERPRLGQAALPPVQDLARVREVAQPQRALEL